MPEVYDFFTPSRTFENHYGYLGVRIRPGVEVVDRDWQAVVQGQMVSLLALPDLAIAPAPAGALGNGANSYALALRQDITTLGVRQAYVRVGPQGKSGLQIGRLDYIQALEVMTGDTVLDWLKRDRIAQLVIGSPDYNPWARTLQGVRADIDTPSVRLTGLVCNPLQVEPHFSTAATAVTTVHAALTFKNGFVPRGEAQIFVDQCNDTRFVQQVDNRPAAQRPDVNQAGGNRITTVGAHYVTRLGSDGDFAAFYARQSGRWGEQTQRAQAWLAEVGLRFPKVVWKPWVRGGYRSFTGDGNPSDSVHGTWMPYLHNARQRFNMYTNPNLDEAFLQLMLTPSPATALRADVRRFHLNTANDLYYAGNGVTQNRGTNGFAGRPSGGTRDIGTLLELQYDHRLDACNIVRVHYAHAFGGSVVRASYPEQTQGSLFYVEYRCIIP